MTEPKIYDVALIGAGPASLAASVYASRYKLSNVVIGPELGGYVSTTHLVEDYLGFESITGLELAEKFVAHAKQFGSEILAEKVTNISKDANIFELTTWSDTKLKAKGILIATGTVHNKL